MVEGEASYSAHLLTFSPLAPHLQLTYNSIHYFACISSSCAQKGALRGRLGSFPLEICVNQGGEGMSQHSRAEGGLCGGIAVTAPPALHRGQQSQVNSFTLCRQN